MSDLLSIGASASRAYGAALAVIGDNVANAQTDGYSRRTVTLSAISPGTAVGYVPPTGGGVIATGVSRASDSFASADARTALSDAGRSDAKVSWLTNTQTALGSSGSDVGAKLTAVYTAGTALSANAGDTTARSTFLSAIGDAATTISSTSDHLKSLQQGIADEASNTVQSLNSTLDALDKVNNALLGIAPNTDAQAQLLDQRDSLLDTVAGYADVDTSFTADGRVQLTLASSGTQLLGANGARLSASRDSSGALAITATTTGGAATPVAISGGTLGGLQDSATSVAAQITALNQIAANFSSSLNAWSAAGTDQTGAAGGALLSYDASVGASSLATTTTAPSAVAAANASSINGNILALAGVRTTDGSESAWAQIVNSNAQQLSAATTEQTTTTARSTAALAARDAASGVNLDSQAADLLRFQQAYSAASKVIQVARDTFQSILDVI